MELTTTDKTIIYKALIKLNKDYLPGEEMKKKISRTMDKIEKSFIVMLFFTTACFGQLHISVGHTDISRQAEGGSFNWSTGITLVNRSNNGVKLNYRAVYTDIAEYKNIDLGYVRRLNSKNYRMDLSVMASYENQKKQVNPLVAIRNSMKLWSDVWLVVDVENTFKIGSESHSYFMAGFAWDL